MSCGILLYRVKKPHFEAYIAKVLLYLLVIMGSKKRNFKLKVLLRRLQKNFLMCLLAFFVATFITVLFYRWMPIYATPLVFIRSAEYALDGRWPAIHKSWTPIEDISIHLQKAVIASEDPKFLKHYGFDFNAISHAYEANKQRQIKLGASTITQQTAKNVFLYPSRTYFRKGLEAYFAVLIELLWDKRRILEVYLNVIELGPGIYGAQAASNYYWNKPAKKLTAGEAQLFAAILPNPRKWNPNHPTEFVLRRRNVIKRNLALMGEAYFRPLTNDQL